MAIFKVSALLGLITLSQARHLIARDVAASTVTVTTTSTLTYCPASSATTPGISSSSGASTSQGGITTTNSRPGGTRTSISASSSTSPTNGDGATQQGNYWVLPDGQRFRNRKVYTFNGASLPAGLQASEDFIQDTTYRNINNIPYNHRFDAVNVKVSNGFLNLKVPGNQHPSSPTRNNPNGTPISCAEVITTECNIKYASVRTKAILSNVPGTCQGMFMYWDDQNEADIEVLSDVRSEANLGSVNPPTVWYSNQANTAGEEPTNDQVDFPSGVNPFDEVHEYRIDWRADRTEFFFDGVKQTTLTSNMPKTPGRWIWNNWANGDPGES
jgi:hypothetical protein